MPDQTDQTSPNPQSLVDAALGTQPEVVTSTTTSTVTPLSPMTPPPLAPLAPPASTTIPLVTPATPTPSVAMGDDTPLAFASMPGSTTTTTTTTSSQPSDAYVPPVPGTLPAAGSTLAPAPEKKKGSTRKIMALFFGFLMLGAAAFGGYTYYMNNFGKTADIAVISAEQNACSGCKNGGWQVWRNGKCKITGICDSGVPGKDTNNPAPSAPVISTNLNTKKKCHANGEGNPGFWCAKVPDGSCGGFCNTSGNKTCNELLQSECGFTQTYGASCATGKDSKDSKYFFGCDCTAGGGDDTWFDRSGLCSHPTGNTGTNAVQNDGLCFIKSACDNNPGGTQYNCTNEGCTALGSTCYIKKYTCKTAVDGYSCTPNTPGFISQSETIQAGTNVKFSNKCGTVEQIDVTCGIAYAVSRTKTNPPCDTTTTTPPPSTPPGAPTMSCTGLTSVPALTPTAPVIGTKLTFTCAGVVTPATAGTLSYKFRYSINTGAITALANKTPTTAELTIAACGTYSVECQACATLNGVLKCDPIWTGATQ